MTQRAWRRGLLAGAAGTAVLNLVTYADMAWRGRDASDTPERIVDALLDRTGRELPGSRGERSNRRTALGALLGTGSGLAVGVLASVARRAGYRPGRVVGTLGTAAAAMGGTIGPMAALGVSDPRTWTASDWVADAVPHLAYAVAADAVIRLDPRPEALDTRRPAPAGLVLRSIALGAATGARSSLGLSAPAVGAGAVRSVVGLAGVGGELVVDKLPSTPSRLSAQGLPLRFASGAAGAGVLARREGARPAAPVAAALAGVAAGSWGGARWRAWAEDRMENWQAGLVEDAVALALALLAALPSRRPA